MEKYETAFKLKVVESFLAGEGGSKLLARRWSVPEEKRFCCDSGRGVDEALSRQ